MKKRILIVSVLTAVIIMIVLIAVTVIATNDTDKTYTFTDENGETVVVSEREIKNKLTKAKQLLRKDRETVVAVVNGKEINAGDLNNVRVSIALSGSDYVSTEKELLDIVIKDYVIEDYVSENGYVYEEENKDVSSSEKADDSQKFISASGLSESEYEEIRLRSRKKNKIYSQYSKQVVGPLLSGEIKLDNERATELQTEYQKQIEIGDPEKMDWDLINACSSELVDIFTQHLVDEADVVIYEDKLN